ncbi:MAG: hypothetical protein NTW56_10735, partial [Alphaproteobacteria bacterium]|nr:hypothetical protein [Alphaproteobacteria bacterium]
MALAVAPQGMREPARNATLPSDAARNWRRPCDRMGTASRLARHVEGAAGRPGMSLNPAEIAR